MQQSGSDSSTSGAWPSGLLLALLAAMGVLGWFQSPFTQDRPHETKEGIRVVGNQDVDARLWQDPFEAVAATRKVRKAQESEACRVLRAGPHGSVRISATCPESPAAAERHGLSALTDEAQIQLDKGNAKILVLGMLVSGAPGAGAAEFRRHQRYAAVAALMQEKFVPRDPEHIGYIEFTANNLPEYVPFEWYSRPANDSDDGKDWSALVLWLDEETLNSPGIGANRSPPRPLVHLSTLLSDIGSELLSDPENLLFRVVGPSSSTTLVGMRREIDRLCASRGQQQQSRTQPGLQTTNPGETEWRAEMWSPVATIRDVPSPCEDLAVSAGPVAVPAPGLEQRTIATDDVLARLLVGELKRRSIAPPAEVALVSQWDTPYSRALGTAIKEEIQALLPGLSTREFHYFRGIDGRVPGTKPEGKAGTDSTNARIERPSGDAQLDYLRRLRDALLDRDMALRKDCVLADRFSQHCGIRAIGVLGNDYFDKLLVLQALKPVFPNAVFFSTDLYADMFLPEDNIVTRNLIVASGYGLTLTDDLAGDDLQGQAPPFRDGYQTSTYLAVRLAAGMRLKSIEDGRRFPPRPRLFEVGRTRPAELLPEIGGAFERAATDPSDLDPHPQDELRRGYALGLKGVPAAMFTLALIGLLVFVWTIVGRDRILIMTALWWGNLRKGKLLAWTVGALGAAIAAGGITLVGHLGLNQAGWQLLFEILVLLTALGLRGLALLAAGRFDRREPAAGLRSWWTQLGDRRPVPWLTLAMVLLGAGVVLIMMIDLGRGGEPFSWSEGISIWPSELLRLGAGALALFLLVRGHRRQLQALRAIEVRFAGLAGGNPEAAPEGNGNKGQVRRIWARYRRSRGFAVIGPRVLREGGLFFLLALCLMIAWGFPNHPARGDLAMGLDVFLIFPVLLPFLALLFYLVDAGRSALELAADLKKRVSWPKETMKKHGLSDWVKRREKWANESEPDPVLLDVQLVGAATAPAGNLVWYPVLILILLALSRLPLFDTWTLPLPLVLVMALTLIYSAASAWLLRRAAEAVRKDAIGQLKDEVRAIRSAGGDDKDLASVEWMLADVRNTREGAFRPFTQQPVVQAMLTLASSATGIALLQYTSLTNF